MTWFSHKLLTGSFLYAATGDPIVAMVAAIGAVIPDAVEGFPKNEEQRAAWRRNHRRISHYIPLYICVFVASQFLLFGQELPRINLLNIEHILQADRLWFTISIQIIAYISTGAIFHVIEDAICGKVPGLTLNHRIGVRWFRVGSLQEYLTVIPLSFALVCISFIGTR